MTARPDVTLLLEGTYPYVSGGVSTWVHQILTAYPDRRFSLLHISPAPNTYEKQAFKVPANVVDLQEVHCRGNEPIGRRGAMRPTPVAARKAPSRFLAAIGRMHLSDHVDEELIADLASNDLSMHELLHGEATFELIRSQLYPTLGAGAPFIDFFWHFRAMHVPMLRLLNAGCPDADVLHAVSTGYAGLVGAIASYKNKRPLLVTEHGLYAREREMELSRATWIKDAGETRAMGCSRPSPLRRFWSHYFRMLSRIAYHQATRLITLSEANKAKQLVDGADPKKIEVVPNGVRFVEPPASATTPVTVPAPPVAGRMRVGFVGRVVPIKDVITLVRAVGLAREQVDLEVWIIGPQDEDAAYAARCRNLCTSLGLDEVIKFLGPQPVSQLYPQLDVVLLTSLSEGQPLVILEAYAAGVPVIATDVGACRELIEGGGDTDRRLGPSGVCTRVANPPATAAALCLLAKHPEMRAAMGRAGLARVTARYQLQQVVASYDNLYSSMVV